MKWKAEGESEKEQAKAGGNGSVIKSGDNEHGDAQTGNERDKKAAAGHDGKARQGCRS